MNEETGAVQQEEENLGAEGAVAEGTEGEGGGDFAFFGGDEVKVEARKPDAHQATIQSVSVHVSEKGSNAIRVAYRSDDTGNDFNEDIYVPALFAEYTGRFVARPSDPLYNDVNEGHLGVEDLPPGEPSATGELNARGEVKIVGNQRAHYGMSIKNSAGDAAVQQLLGVAAKLQLKPGPLTRAINVKSTFEDYVAALNEVLSGMPLIIKRRAEKSEDNPRGFLKVAGRVSRIGITEDPIEPKAVKSLAKYLRQWEVGA